MLGIAQALTVLLCDLRVAQAAVKQIPGTHVTIDLPEDYEPFSNVGIMEVVSGFAHPRLDVRFSVPVELRGPTLEWLVGRLSLKSGQKELLERRWRKPRIGKLERTDQHLYIRFTKSATGRDQAVFMLVFGAADQTVEIVATVPPDKLNNGTVQVADIERVLASARIVERRLEMDRPFRLAYLAPILAELPGKQLPDQSVYDLRTARSARDVGAAWLRVFALPAEAAPSVKRFDLTRRLRGGLDFPDQETAAAEQWIRQGKDPNSFLPYLTLRILKPSVNSRREVKVAGLTGVELVGAGILRHPLDREFRFYGQPPAARKEVGLYQVVLNGKDLDYVIMGEAESGKFSHYLPEFRKMVKSFTIDREVVRRKAFEGDVMQLVSRWRGQQLHGFRLLR